MCTGDDKPVVWALHRVQEEDEAPSTLRRRRVAGDSADAAASRTSTLAQLPAAPLRWFAGAMPPMALKAAQQHFWRGAPSPHYRCRPHVQRVVTLTLSGLVLPIALESVVDATNAQARLRDLPVPKAQQPADDCSDVDEPAAAAGEPECSEEVSRLLDKLAVSQAHGGGAGEEVGDGTRELEGRAEHDEPGESTAVA